MRDTRERDEEGRRNWTAYRGVGRSRFLAGSVSGCERGESSGRLNSASHFPTFSILLD